MFINIFSEILEQLFLKFIAEPYALAVGPTDTEVSC